MYMVMTTILMQLSIAPLVVEATPSSSLGAQDDDITWTTSASLDQWTQIGQVFTHHIPSHSTKSSQAHVICSCLVIVRFFPPLTILIGQQ
jgi:hypothetical protein